MKKLLITITAAILITGLVGLTTITAKNNKAEQPKQETTTQQPAKQSKQTTVKTEQKAPEQPKYNIEKIVVPVQIDADTTFKPFQDLSIELIQTIAAENNIPVELKELSFNDIGVALTRNEIDLRSMTSNTIDPEMTQTYSYLTGKLHPDLPENDYAFTVHKDNTELSNLINDGISKFKENGKLTELQNKYLPQ
jgi:hypothetical protein